MKLIAALAALTLSFTAGAFAADEKIEGEAKCAKCALKETKTCQNVVMVTKDGKTTNYYLEQNDFSKKAHQGLGICQAKKDDPVKVKVTGTVVEKDGKNVLTPTAAITEAD